MRRTSVQIYKSDRGILKSRSFSQCCSAKKKTFKSNGIPLWLCPSSVAPPFHVPSVGTKIWVVRWQCVELGGAGGGRDSQNSLNNLHFFLSPGLTGKSDGRLQAVLRCVANRSPSPVPFVRSHQVWPLPIICLQSLLSHQQTSVSLSLHSCITRPSAMCYKKTKCSLGVWVHLAVLLSRWSSQQSRMSFSSRPEKRWRNSCLFSALSCSVEACFNSLWTKTDSGGKWYLPNEFSELRQYSYRTKEQRNLRNKQFTRVLAAYYTFLHVHRTFPCNFQKKKNEKKNFSFHTRTAVWSVSGLSHWWRKSCKISKKRDWIRCIGAI